MESVGVVLSAGITIFSLGLLIITLFSYHKYRSIRLLLISLVFVVFLFKGVVFSLSFFSSEFTSLAAWFSGTYWGVFDLIILVLLFIATLKR